MGEPRKAAGALVLRELGFSTLGAYALERCSRGGRWAAESRGLARRLASLPRLSDALETGAIGWSMAELLARHATAQTEAALLIARIATADTERAWVERAARRTFKHLREEVHAVEIAVRLGGQTDRAPPSEERIEQMQALERSILSGELLRNVARNPGPEPPAVEPDQAEGAEAADESRGTEKPEEATSFLQFLCVSFWRTWVPTLGVSDRWEAIYRRDRYRCTSPVCHQRNVTLHHVEYRAHGGSDDPDNLNSACAFCHWFVMVWRARGLF